MTILISMFGFAGRFAGDLLTSALGWASSLLFGRVPRSHQIFLVLMMAFSFLWLLFVIGLVLPSIASFLLDATPHPPFVDRQWVGFVLLVGVVVLPLLVGLAGYLVPATWKRPEGAAAFRELARGYLLAPLISGLLIFLSGVGIVRKIRSKRHGWSDVHIPVVMKPNGYDEVVADLGHALDSAGLDAKAEEAPWVLTVPARLLTAVSSSNVRKLRPDRLIELRGPDLRVGVYPSDIAISGPVGARTRARAAILSRLATTAAHQTTSSEAQALEDDILKVAESGRASGGTLGPSARAAFEEIDQKLLELDVPTDEWDILYRLRLQVERDLLAGAKPGTTFPGHESDAGGPDTPARAEAASEKTDQGR
jgi:hypothetical protein